MVFSSSLSASTVLVKFWSKGTRRKDPKDLIHISVKQHWVNNDRLLFFWCSTSLSFYGAQTQASDGCFDSSVLFQELASFSRETHEEIPCCLEDGDTILKKLTVTASRVKNMACLASVCVFGEGIQREHRYSSGNQSSAAGQRMVPFWKHAFSVFAGW